MTDEQDVFDRAEADCLAECFKVLTIELLIPNPSADDTDERFRRCCATCRRAREIARGK